MTTPAPIGLADPLLTPIEARIVGCLMEKQRTTPEQYPLTLNALVSACNQKSSRHPVMQLDPGEVGRSVNRLRDRGLVHAGLASRTERYDHKMVGTYHLSREEQAVLAVLMLRGPQTLGELRTNSGRMAEFADLAGGLRGPERAHGALPVPGHGAAPGTGPAGGALHASPVRGAGAGGASGPGRGGGARRRRPCVPGCGWPDPCLGAGGGPTARGAGAALGADRTRGPPGALGHCDSPSEPPFALEIGDRQQRRDHHEHDRQRIAVFPGELGHVLVIHPVDAGDKGRR